MNNDKNNNQDTSKEDEAKKDAWIKLKKRLKNIRILEFWICSFFDAGCQKRAKSPSCFRYELIFFSL
jgi:hypothetical protein